MANIGDRLLQPEDGWKRIDNTEDKIIYSGSTWNEQTNNDKYYNSTLHYCHTSGGIITIYFYGTSFRLLGKMSSIYTSINKIAIDNQPTETFSCYDASIADTDVMATTRILYEVQDLQKTIHKVEIETVAQSGRTYCLVFDCIDIDEDGYLLSPPANIGDQLLQPERGWKRYNGTDALILKEPTVTGQYSGVITDESLYEGTAYQLLGGTIRFYANAKKIRIIGFRSSVSSYTNNAEIYVDGIKIGSFSNAGNSIVYQCLLYDGELGNGTHEVVISNNTGLYLNLDAIDIDEDGYLLTEEEFKKSNKFPVLVGDDTITSEENIAHYCETLTNGERQLLVSDKLKGIYLTDGQGGYVNLNKESTDINLPTDEEIDNMVNEVINNVFA